jgi:hypothetical protein
MNSAIEKTIVRTNSMETIEFVEIAEIFVRDATIFPEPSICKRK